MVHEQICQKRGPWALKQDFTLKTGVKELQYKGPKQYGNSIWRKKHHPTTILLQHKIFKMESFQLSSGTRDL